MITLIDVAAEFWRNSLGGKLPLQGYEYTLERIDWYRRECDRTVVCCDSPNLLRKQWFEGYKASRKDKPPGAMDALISVQQRAEAWGLPVVQCAGYEADDVIATLAKQAWPEPVQIIGSEKDFFCLISETVRLIGKNGPIGGNECFEKFGVLPSQMTDWLTLVGDNSDDIPGCPNCGPGRATLLLDRFDTLAGILAATDDQLLAIKGVGKATLASLREWDPTLARRLIQLMEDAPVDLDGLFDR